MRKALSSFLVVTCSGSLLIMTCRCHSCGGGQLSTRYFILDDHGHLRLSKVRYRGLTHSLQIGCVLANLYVARRQLMRGRRERGARDGLGASGGGNNPRTSSLDQRMPRAFVLAPCQPGAACRAEGQINPTFPNAVSQHLPEQFLLSGPCLTRFEPRRTAHSPGN